MKKIFLFTQIFLLLFLTNFSKADIFQRRIFYDDFEINLNQWQTTILHPNTIEISTEKYHSGSRSVKFNYIDGNNKYLSAIHSFPSQTNIVLRGWFYDDMSSQKGVAFGLVDSSTGYHTLVGVMTSKYPNSYFIRHNSLDNTYDTGIKREPGWHLFEIIVTPNGGYAKIDNKFLANFKNIFHKKADQVSIDATWGLTSVNYFDDIEILTVNYNINDELKSLISKYLYLYKYTDFSSIYPKLGIDDLEEGRLHGNDVRSLLNLVYALIFDWKVNSNQDSLNKALNLTNDIVNYTRWNEINRWSVAVPATRLVRVASALWDYLSLQTKEKILIILGSLGNEFLNRQPMSGYINDTKAEENAWNAAFLVTLSKFYDFHINSSLWEEKGKCFAWHSVTTSKDPYFCGIKTQTAWDDFQLDNHNLHPNPVYMGAVFTLLTEASFPYRALGKTIPSELKHNLSPLFEKLLTYVVEDSYHFQVNGRPFADWSGIVDTFYYPWWTLDFINSENLAPGVNVQLLKENVFRSRSLFYTDTLSELVERPLIKLEKFDQLNRQSDGYKFFLNSLIAESLVLNYFWNNPQGIFRSLKWKITNNNITWQPLIWEGGPLIEYSIENNQPVFSFQSQYPSNAEVYSSLIPVKPNKKYVISWWVKTENLNSQGKYPGVVIVAEYNSYAKETDKITENRLHAGNRENIPKPTQNNDWQQFSYTFQTTPQTAFVRLRALNAGWGTSTGKVWFKNIKIEEINCEENLTKTKLWYGDLAWDCDDQIKIEGNSSIRLESKQFSGAEVYSPLIPVKPNQTYRVSYWVKTENLIPSDAKAYGKIIAAQYNSYAKESDEVNQNRIDPGFDLGENIGGTVDWVKKSYTFKTSPQTVFVRLRAPMGLGGSAKGKVWFDGVKIEEVVSTSSISDSDVNIPNYNILYKIGEESKNNQKITFIDIKAGISKEQSAYQDGLISINKGKRIYLKWEGRADFCYALGSWKGYKGSSGLASYYFNKLGTHIFALVCITQPSDIGQLKNNLLSFVDFDYVEINVIP